MNETHARTATEPTVPATSNRVLDIRGPPYAYTAVKHGISALAAQGDSQITICS